MIRLLCVVLKRTAKVSVLNMKDFRIVLKCETSGDIDSLEVAPEKNIAYRAIKELAQELGRTETRQFIYLFQR